MLDAPLYITLLVFIHEGEADLFHTYEDQVLPILARYNGELLYRIRPDKQDFVTQPDDYPYEIHLLTFPSSTDFEHYRQDKDRLAHFPLFQKSVRKVMLLQSVSI